jgi:flagellar export protein FliJ
MPPRFSLQSVLDYHRNRVEVLEIELSLLVAAQQQAQVELDALQGRLAAEREELRQKQAGLLDLGAIDQLRLNIKGTEAAIVRQEQILADLARQVEAKRTQLIEAKQDEETLNTLREKELERFLAEEARRDNRLQDDIYISRAYRRGSQERTDKAAS